MPLSRQMRLNLEAANGAPLRYTPGRAVPSTCRHCNRLVLAGWDDTICARWAILDPVHLTPTQEAACWLHLGIITYELLGIPGKWQFGRIRVAPWITNLLVSKPIGFVTPAHTCRPPPSNDLIPVYPPHSDNLPEFPPF